MPNSEDYTVVWIGVSRIIEGDEVGRAEDGSHPLIEQARKVGLDHWFDTFDNTPEGDPVFSLLLGERLEILGYKEGRSQFSVTPDEITERSNRINQRLREIGVKGLAALHVLLRIED